MARVEALTLGGDAGDEQRGQLVGGHDLTGEHVLDGHVLLGGLVQQVEGPLAGVGATIRSPGPRRGFAVGHWCTVT